MKQSPSFLHRLDNRHYLVVWLLYHCGIVLVFGLRVLLARSPLYFDADVMNMLPMSFDEPAIAIANDMVTEPDLSTGWVVFCHQDFEKARSTATAAYEKLCADPKIEKVAFYEDTSSTGEMLDYIHQYRWNLLKEDVADSILAPGGAEAFATNALSQAYGTFTLTGLAYLDDDPFLLTDQEAASYLEAISTTGLTLPTHNGVQAVQRDGNWYVVLVVTIDAAYSGVSGTENGAAAIYNICRPYETGDVRVLYRGTPFISHENAERTTREVAAITTISMILVVIILLLVFGTPLPIVSSVAAILVSMLAAVLGTLAVFGNIHILALLFGTSLIGSCIDYSLHFFINWKANTNLATTGHIRTLMFRGLSLSLASTVLCYVVLLFIPYTLVKQMALFSIIGLISSFLTTISIYPYLPIPKETARIMRSVRIVKTPGWYNKKLIGRVSMSTAFVVLLLLAFVWRGRIRVFNDLDSLYSLSERIGNDTREVDAFLQYYPKGWFIVKGATEDEVLEREARLARAFEGYCAEHGFEPRYAATAKFVPSLKAQEKSREAAQKLLLFAEEQYDALGYEPEYAEELRRSFGETKNSFVTITGGDMPQYLLDALSSMWLGEINGNYYSLFVPCLTFDDDSYRAMAAGDPNIFYVNKTRDVSRDLDRLTTMILIFFVLAYVAMFILLKFFYRMKHALKIISVPVLIMLTITVVLAAQGQPLEFFSIVGMILVLGLGLDYIIYMMENEKRSKKTGLQKTGFQGTSLQGTDDSLLEPFAIFLSFITTALSFGALAFSSFTPVHNIGLSIFIGLVTAYISSVMYDRS